MLGNGYVLGRQRSLTKKIELKREHQKETHPYV